MKTKIISSRELDKNLNLSAKYNIKKAERKARTKKEYEAYLNQYYNSEVGREEAFEQLVYVTNPKRGKDHISEKALRKAVYNDKAGSILRKYDPIAFTIGYDVWQKVSPGKYLEFIKATRR